MAILTKEDRKRSRDFGKPWDSFPDPKGVIDKTSRAHIFGSFMPGLNPVPDSPYYIGDHVARAMLLMIEQFKPATNLKNFISSFIKELQKCEDTLQDLMTRRLISTAQGVLLDEIGLIVGEEREGRIDEDYQLAIYERIFINISNGEPETIVRATRFLMDSEFTRYFEIYPAEVLLNIGSESFQPIISILQRIVPVCVSLSVSNIYASIPFSFDGEGGIPFSEGLGFSEYNYLESGAEVGGQVSELII
jgi:hypothetical protein